MVDYGSGKLGGFQFPVSGTATTTEAFLQATDPALYIGLDFLAAMIVTHIGARLVAEAAAVGLTWTSAIQAKVPIDPGPFLATENFKPPFMALHRMSSTFTQKSTVRKREQGEWQLIYVLPAMTSGQTERLRSALSAIAKILCERIEQGADPTYTPPGGSAGDSAWEAAGIDYIEASGYKIGGFTDGGNLYMPALTMSIRVIERSTIVATDYEAMTTVDGNVDADGVSDIATIRTDTT